MSRFLACSMLLLAGLAGVARSQTPTSFAGTWELDKTKSQSLPRMWENVEGVTLVVTQDAKQMSVETSVKGGQGPGAGAGPRVLSYNLDGTETTAEVGGRMPGKARLTAKWADGKALDLTSVRNLNFQGNDVTFTNREHWELAEGGTVLKVRRLAETPRGTQESILIFNKR